MKIRPFLAALQQFKVGQNPYIYCKFNCIHPPPPPTSQNSAKKPWEGLLTPCSRYVKESSRPSDSRSQPRILDPEEWIPDPESWIPDSKLTCSTEMDTGFFRDLSILNSIKWILDSTHWIPDSKASHFLDSFASGDLELNTLVLKQQ